jgi:Fe-S cluster assembly protein SufD
MEAMQTTETMEKTVQESGLYRDAFAALERERRSEPAWLRRLREDAFTRFSELGFPSAKVEAWKYTNTAPIAEKAWTPATRSAAGDAVSERALAPWRIPGAVEIVFINGAFSKKHSRVPAAQGGVTVQSLPDLLTSSPEKAEPWIGKQTAGELSAFASWNTAFFVDGAYVEIAPGAVVATPVHLLFVTAQENALVVSSPRVLVLAGARSQATVVETYVGDGDAVSLTNAVTEISVGESAVLEHLNREEESRSAYHVHAIETRQSRGSGFTQHNLTIGGLLARTDLNILFTGEGAECTLNGLFVGSGTQHLDNHTRIDHAQPHCSSRELYKGILDGKARGVFHGTILVRKGAQKTDAMQTNKNLLLSREALVDSTPALEILADDVKCRHGSTIGQLDANALFYLRSRGIDEEHARSMLTYAFAADVAGRIKIPAIRSQVEKLLGLRFSQTGSEETSS